MPTALGNYFAYYLCGIMIVLGAIIVAGLLMQKVGKKKK
jgi:hypothetical protein